MGVLQDVTEQKEAARRQTLLAREVDHRAKNMLGVVQAMLRLTKASDQESFVQSVEGRIGALARAQRALAMSRWSSADLAADLRGNGAFPAERI
jgi:two-component sensor histidine kinase